jgi:hypothetical protein
MAEQGRSTTSVSWWDILRSPLDVDVIADAGALSVVCLLWSVFNAFLFFFTLYWVGNSLFMTGGFILFSQEPTVTDQLPRFADRSDKAAGALHDMTMTTAAAVTGAGAVIATLVSLGGGLGLVYSALRMWSFLCGKYLAICRRAALGAIGLSNSDAGGIRDLARFLAVGLVALLPFFLVCAMGGASSSFESNDGGSSIAILVVVLLWAGLYLPMGMAVLSLEHSLNPVTVLIWAFKCTPDYLWCCLFSSCFTAAVTVVSLLIQKVFLGCGIAAAVVPAFLVGLSLNQYNAALMCNVVGLLVRRHRTKLDPMT